MSFLAVMLALMAFRQVLTLASWMQQASDWSLTFGNDVSEVPGLLVSVMAFLFVFFVADILPISPPLGDDSEPLEASRRLAILATAIGLLTAVAAVGVGYLAFSNSRDAICQTIASDNLAVAQTVLNQASVNPSEAVESDADRQRAFERIKESWMRTDSPYPDSFLCVVEQPGRIAWHSRNPELQGQDVSMTPIDADQGNDASTVRDLLTGQENWSGRNVDLHGATQLIAYKYSPGLDSLVAVHVPASSIDERIRVEATPWMIAFGALTGLLIPLALGWMHFNYSRVERAARQNWTALRQSEARLSDIAASFPGVIYQMSLSRDGEYQLEYISDGVLAMLGIEPRTLTVAGFDPFQLVHSADVASVVKEAKQSAADMTTVAHECRVRHANGQLIWVQVSSTPHRRADGTIVWYGVAIDVTLQMETEQRVRESEARLAAAQRIARLGSWELDLVDLADVNRNPLRWSDEVFRIFGYEPGGCEVSNDNFFHMVHPDDRIRIQETVAESLRSNTPYQLEHRIVRADGEVRVVYEESRIAVDDENGRPLKMRGIIQDVHERTAAESALRDSEQRFRTVFEQAAVGVGLLESKTGRFIRINQKYSKMIGYESDELAGDTFMRITHPDDLQDDLDNMRRLLDGEIREFSMEKRLFHKDGTVIWVNLTVSPTWLPGEEPLHHIAIVEDISDRKHVESERERLAEILEATPDLVGIADAAGRTVYLNPAGRNMVRIADDEDATQTTIADFLTDDAVEQFMTGPLQIASRDGFWSGETIIRRRDGSVFPASQVLIAHKSQQGDVERFSTILRDISELKEAELAVRHSEELLRKVVDTNPSLIHAKDPDGRFLLANRAVGEFYDLPLDQIVGRTQTEIHVAQAMNPNELAKWLDDDRAVAESGRLQTIIESSADRNGKQHWYRTIKLPLQLNAKSVGVLVTSHDITDSKRAELFRDGQNRMLKRLAAGEPLTNVLSTLIEAVEDQSDGMIGSVLLCDESRKSLRLGAAPHLPAAANRALDGFPIGPDCAACGTAAFRNERVIIEDVFQSPLTANYREFARHHELAAVWSQPIRSADGNVIGTFALYYHEPRRPDSRELEIIETAANLAGIAIERRHAEAELTRQVDFNRRILETTMDGYLLSRIDGQLLDVNPAYCRISGYDRETLRKMNVRELEINLSETEFRDVVSRLLHDRSARFETQHRREEGSLIDLDASLTVLPSESEPLIAGFVRDISEQKRAEKSLRHSEEKYRRLVELLQEGLWVVDADSVTTFVNERMASMLGLAVEDIIGRKLFDFVDPAELESTRENLERVKSGAAELVEATFMRRDGRPIFALLATAPIHSDNGQYTGTIAGILDITARRRAEDDLKDLNAELEARVAERTRELAERNDELDAFARSVSHDLRAPLRAMEGFAVALTEDYARQLDDKARQYLKHITDSASRMEVLINDLFTYSRLGLHEIRCKPVDLANVVDDAIAQLQAEIECRRAKVKVAERLPRVLGHASTVFQIVTNLLTNALKFVDAGVDPDVSITAEAKDGRVRLIVRDNGIGIAPEHHERIFKVFERLHGIESYPGTGIGLAIVNRAVERMNGTCGVESCRGGGSAFWIELAAEELVHDR